MTRRSRLARLLLSLALFALLVPGGGCDERPQLRGAGCDLTTDCDDFLVCGFGRCRQECRTEVDCALGLDCFRDSSTGLGYCQLPDELNCTRNSDCQMNCGAGSDCEGKITCRDGECGQACAEDRDCVEGSVCAESAGVNTCEPVAPELCVYNSDCAPGLICDPYQRCRIECAEDRDCEFPRVCQMRDVDGFPTPLCVLPESDGGVAAGDGGP